jgi:hypothetical protein
MTDALSAMEYPHWLMVAGAVLVVLHTDWRSPTPKPCSSLLACLNPKEASPEHYLWQ